MSAELSIESEAAVQVGCGLNMVTARVMGDYGTVWLRDYSRVGADLTPQECRELAQFLSIAADRLEAA